MLAGVSHDLRTPLTRLKLALAMMDETDDIKAALADLDDMSMMLDEYLTFARGEEGDDPGDFDLAELVRDAAAGFGPHVTVAGPERIMVNGRRLAIKRAVTNLISNATKFATDTQSLLWTVRMRPIYTSTITDPASPQTCGRMPSGPSCGWTRPAPRTRRAPGSV